MIIETRRQEESKEDFENFCDKLIMDISTMRRRIEQRISIKDVTRNDWEMSITVDITPIECHTLDDFGDGC